MPTGILKDEVDLSSRWGKSKPVGTRPQTLTDMNRFNGNHGRDVILLEVDSFNNGRF